MRGTDLNSDGLCERGQTEQEIKLENALQEKKKDTVTLLVKIKVQRMRQTKT